GICPTGAVGGCCRTDHHRRARRRHADTCARGCVGECELRPIIRRRWDAYQYLERNQPGGYPIYRSVEGCGIFSDIRFSRFKRRGDCHYKKGSTWQATDFIQRKLREPSIGEKDGYTKRSRVDGVPIEEQR